MVQVIKATGQKEPFSEEKLLVSVRRAGVPQDLQNHVLQTVQQRLHDDIPTSEIYHVISDTLKNSKHPYTQASYSLKQAIMDLGPTGYPFEDFIAEILSSQGYKTKVRQILMGKCVSHEVDVIAEKDGITAMIEAKFHNSLGIHSDVRVPMYTKSRFEDLKDKHNLHEAWIITNTKVTTDAIAYAHCVGMKIIGWSYPDQGSLRDMIEQAGLHPITVLTSLSPATKAMLLAQHIVRCKSIHENPRVLDTLGISHEQKEKVLQEVQYICRNEQHS